MAASTLMSSIYFSPLLPPKAILFSKKNPTPIALLAKPFSSSSQLSLHQKWSHHILVPPAFSAVASSEATVEEEEEETVEESMPPPVEAQIAASAAAETSKGEEVFAVVMIILNKVLLVGTRRKTYIGRPVVTNAAVHAVVEEQGLDKKVIVFKYKKKKNYRRNIGHRQPNTRIRITGISGFEDFPAETMPAA